MSDSTEYRGEPIISAPGFGILVHEAEEGETGYWAEVLTLPGYLSQGETLEELYANIYEAIRAVLPQADTDTARAPHDISLWPSATTHTT